MRNLYPGVNVLVEVDHRDSVVKLQPFRRARLVNFPEYRQQEFGVTTHTVTTYRPLPSEDKTITTGFSFDGSANNAIGLHELSAGQLVDVLPISFAESLERQAVAPKSEPTLPLGALPALAAAAA